jgi:hypothetical protein
MLEVCEQLQQEGKLHCIFISPSDRGVTRISGAADGCACCDGGARTHTPNN